MIVDPEKWAQLSRSEKALLRDVRFFGGTQADELDEIAQIRAGLPVALSERGRQLAEHLTQFGVAAPPPTKGHDAAVTDGEIVLDGRWSPRQREILDTVMGEAEAMPLDERLRFLERKGHEFREEKDDRQLSLGVEFWRRAARMAKNASGR